MSLSSLAECRTYQFFYKNREALYFDHRGLRVLADVEGSGTFSISALPDQTTIWVDGTQAGLDSRQFFESLVVVSSNAGLSEISVQRGFQPRVVGHPLVVEKFNGCGWILSSDSIQSVDGLTDGWGGMVQTLPVPVMTEAVGLGMRIQPIKVRVEKLLEMDVADSEELFAGGWQVKNASKLFDLTSELPGVGMVSGLTLSHLNEGSFLVDKPEGCEGIVIRKLYDAFHGRQRARLIVDGKFEAWWYEPVEDRKRRWRWGQIGFTTLPGPQIMRVGIDPPAGSPLWSVSKIEVLGLFPGG